MPSRSKNPVKVTRLDGSTAVIGTGRLPRALVLAVFQRDGFACRYCGFTGASEWFEVEHVKPRVKGGTDEMSNLVVACWPCNAQKKTNTWVLGAPLTSQPGFDLKNWHQLKSRHRRRLNGENVRPRKVGRRRS